MGANPFRGIPASARYKLFLWTVLSMLRYKRIDPHRASDKTYILKAYRRNLKAHPLELRMYVLTEDEFIEQARHANRTKAKASAIILLFTAVEHITNHYIRVFAELRGLPCAEINKMLRVNHSEKSGWLAALLGFNIPAVLASKVDKLRAIRNRIVHCQRAPDVSTEAGDKDGSWSEIKKLIQGMRMREFLGLPEKLRNELERAYQVASPDFPAAHEMTDIIIEDFRKRNRCR